MLVQRDGNILYDIEIDDNSKLIHEVMGDEMLAVSFNSNNKYLFEIGDYVMFENKQFTLNNEPHIKKEAKSVYSYKMNFEGLKYNLVKKMLMFDGEPDFWMLGDAEDFLDLIITNINTIDPTWTKSVIAVTDLININFQFENCLSALNRICGVFDVEFEVLANKVINIRKRLGIDTGLTIEHKKGAYIIERLVADESSLCTKVYAYGGEKNLSDTYGHKRLYIAPKTNNVATYGTIENILILDDIIPKFEGSVDSASSTVFADTDIDFNLNDQLLPGIPAKVVFLSGDLAGYEFEVASFNNSLKEVTINKINNEGGIELPNSSLEIITGDKYTFIDIEMPGIYVTNAETLLSDKAQEYIDDRSEPKHKFTISIDEHYIRENTIDLIIGNQFTILDSEFNINEVVRINKITKSIVNEYKVAVELANDAFMNRWIRMANSQYNISRKLDILRKSAIIIKHS